MSTVHLLSAAWHGDAPLTLDFPDNWEVSVLGDQSITPLPTEAVHRAVLEPVSGPPLAVLAAGKTSAAIILDDLSRPTPTADLVPVLLEELHKAGIAYEKILIIAATGTHPPASLEELVYKAGGDLPPGVRLLSHDCHHGLKHLGKSRRGVPISMNEAVLDCELRIGVGCLYPHPAAGFSGGAKALVPGLAGFETIRFLHDHFRAADRRAGNVDNDFRLECEQIAAQIGLHFVVNVSLNQKRQISAVFAGDMIQAFRRGVQDVREKYIVHPLPDTDIVIADMYPFDSDLTFAYDRGLWPLDFARESASRVVLAACPKGIGSHDLFPLQNSFISRLTRRLKHFQIRDIRTLVYRLNVAKRLLERKSLEVLVVSPGLTETQLRSVFSSGVLVPDWNTARQRLETSHTGSKEKVIVYRAAPLMIPSTDYTSPFSIGN